MLQIKNTFSWKIINYSLLYYHRADIAVCVFFLVYIIHHFTNQYGCQVMRSSLKSCSVIQSNDELHERSYDFKWNIKRNPWVFILVIDMNGNHFAIQTEIISDMTCESICRNISLVHFFPSFSPVVLMQNIRWRFLSLSQRKHDNFPRFSVNIHCKWRSDESGGSQHNDFLFMLS